MAKPTRVGRTSPHWLVLLILYLAVAATAPTLAWLKGWPARPWNDELSSATAMVAFAMLLMEFTSTGRIQFITDRLHHDMTMKWHRGTAIVVLVIAVLHPFFYTQQDSSPPVDDPTNLVHLGLNGWSLPTGIAGFMLLVALVTFAAFRNHLDYRYETWRIGHALGAVVVSALVLTHVLSGGRYSQIAAIRWFWIGLAALAALALIYTFVVLPLFMRRRPYRLARREHIREGEWSLTFEPNGFVLPGFRPGQFVWLSFNSPFSILEHPFTVPGNQTDANAVRLSIHEVGDWTRQVAEIPIGSTAFLNGPYG